jgi:hypothetical protein
MASLDDGFGIAGSCTGGVGGSGSDGGSGRGSGLGGVGSDDVDSTGVLAVVSGAGGGAGGGGGGEGLLSGTFATAGSDGGFEIDAAWVSGDEGSGAAPVA